MSSSYTCYLNKNGIVLPSDSLNRFSDLIPFYFISLKLIKGAQRWVLETRAVNEPSFGSLGKVKSSNLAWARDEPKNSVWVWTRGKVKKFEFGLVWLGLTWLTSQAKFKLNIKLKLKLRLNFWAWDFKKKKKKSSA